MIGKILPILLAIIGLGGGVGAGIMLRPEPDPIAMENPCGDVHMAKAEMKESAEPEEEEPSGFDYVKLNNQFVVPVVVDGRIGALVVMSLSLEVTPGENETVYKMEPKLRDLFLQVMFDHANTGGFDGAFTKSARMDTLRKALTETAQNALGDIIANVLIVDVVRQDA